MAWQYGVAQTVAATMYSGGEPTAPTGALTATISKDGAGFGAIAGSVAQIGATPCVLLSLTIADMTCATGVVRIVDAGGAVDDRYVEFCTEADYTAAVAARIDDYITSREASGAAATAVATLNDFDPALDVVAHVTLVDTTTANTDMRGTDGAALAATALTDATWTNARAGKLDNLDAAVTSREASGAAASAVSGLNDFDPSAETVDVGAVAGVAVIGVDDFKADVSGLALTGEAATAVGTLNDFDPALDVVAHVTLVDTTTTNTDMRGTDGAELAGAAAAAVGGLNDFDPTSDTVDVGAVAGAAVTGVNDFKADVSGLALTGEAATAVGTLNDFDPAAETVDVGAVAGVAVTGVNDFKADVSGLALTGEAATAVGTLNDLSAAEVEDAVWDAATADHTAAGSMGVAVSGAGDPWSTALPGLYGAGTAGKLVGDNLDAKISTRSTLTAAQVWAAGTRTLTGFGTLVADVATAVWTAVARTITGGTVTTVSDKTGYALTAAYDAAQTAAQAAALATVAANVLRTLGLSQENQYIDSVTVDVSGRMTSARLRTYSVAGSVGTINDVLATYTITATYTGTEEAPTTYKVVRV